MRTDTLRSGSTRGRRMRRAALIAALVLTLAVTFVVVSRREDGGPDGEPSPASGPPTLQAVDGGLDYYSRFFPSFPADEDFFPLAVWFESVTDPEDVRRDAAAGLNTYVELTSNSDLDLISRAGMRAIHSDVGAAGDETAGWLLADESDMWAGPGYGTWSGRYPGEGDICEPAGADCGYTVQEELQARLP